ncbi:MAG: hypothetical protein ACE5HS_07365 [bacterium]
MKIKKICQPFFTAVLFIFLLTNTGCESNHTTSETGLNLFNLTHLDHLYEEVVIDGKEMAIIHIYCEYPDYRWVDAADEGIACVDDVARAAVVYLRHFEISGEESSLHKAQKLLEFCRYMQADDGLFYNFIFTDHTINRHGETSFKSLGWWSVRAIWALAEGFRVYQQRDSSYAALLQTQIQKTFTHIDTLLERYPEVDIINGFKVPKWLLYHSAADATSELMLGLTAYVKAAGDSTAMRYIKTFAEGLLQMQVGDREHFPYGMFLSWRNVWHGWANGQTQALAYMSQVVHNETFQNAAMKEASYFYPYWIGSGFPREYKLVRADSFGVESKQRFAQIAYNLRPAVVGALKLYDLTKDEKYARLAGELATWFFGNNPAQAQMYDAETGRGFDGILSETEINRNAGAESTIEALYSILEVEANPIASKYLHDYINSK